MTVSNRTLQIQKLKTGSIPPQRLPAFNNESIQTTFKGGKTKRDETTQKKNTTAQNRKKRTEQAIVLTFNAGGIRGSYWARTAGRPCSLDCFSAMPMAVLVSEVASPSSFTFFRKGSNNSSGELWRAEKGGDDNMMHPAHKQHLLSTLARPHSGPGGPPQI